MHQVTQPKLLKAGNEEDEQVHPNQSIDDILHRRLLSGVVVGAVGVVVVCGSATVHGLSDEK